MPAQALVSRPVILGSYSARQFVQRYLCTLVYGHYIHYYEVCSVRCIRE